MTALAVHVVASTILLNLNVALWAVLDGLALAVGRKSILKLAIAVIMWRLAATKAKLRVATTAMRYRSISTSRKESGTTQYSHSVLAIGSSAPFKCRAISFDKRMQLTTLIIRQEMGCHLPNLFIRHD
jgi:hypothetical protein